MYFSLYLWYWVLGCYTITRWQQRIVKNIVVAFVSSLFRPFCFMYRFICIREKAPHVTKTKQNRRSVYIIFSLFFFNQLLWIAYFFKLCKYGVCHGFLLFTQLKLSYKWLRNPFEKLFFAILSYISSYIYWYNKSCSRIHDCSNYDSIYLINILIVY